MVERNSSPFLYFPWTSPVTLLSVIRSTLPSLTSLTSSEKLGWTPGILLLLNTAQTSTTRHRMISHKTAFLTLEFIDISQNRCELLLTKTTYEHRKGQSS